jgi:periplasmic protein TonB
MNSNKILSSDVLDILFEKRNKKYGAYILRKFYPSRVKTSLFIMLGMSAILSAFTFLPDNKITGSHLYTGNDSIIVKEYESPKEKEQPKEKQHDLPKTSTQKFIDKIAIVDSMEKTDSLHDITHIDIGTVTHIIDAPAGPPDIFPAAPTGTGGNLPTVAAAPVVDINAPVDNPDMQASYPGGEKELIKFLQHNLQSPDEMEEGAAVQVRIKFVVGFDGNLQAFDVLQDGGNAFNNEVIRVLKKMPRWDPGKKGGRNVPVYYTLPVKFAAN